MTFDLAAFRRINSDAELVTTLRPLLVAMESALNATNPGAGFKLVYAEDKESMSPHFAKFLRTDAQGFGLAFWISLHDGKAEVTPIVSPLPNGKPNGFDTFRIRELVPYGGPIRREDVPAAISVGLARMATGNPVVVANDIKRRLIEPIAWLWPEWQKLAAERDKGLRAMNGTVLLLSARYGGRWDAERGYMSFPGAALPGVHIDQWGHIRIERALSPTVRVLSAMFDAMLAEATESAPA